MIIKRRKKAFGAAALDDGDVLRWAIMKQKLFFSISSVCKCVKENNPRTLISQNTELEEKDASDTASFYFHYIFMILRIDTSIVCLTSTIVVNFFQ